MNKFIGISLLFASLSALSQDVSAGKKPVHPKELELVQICQKLYDKKRTDDEKMKLNAQLIEKFTEVLSEENSFKNYQFDTLRNDIGVLTSPDNVFRIIHWNIPQSDGTHQYYGFIQEQYGKTLKKGLFKKERVESVLLFQLNDKSAEIRNPENSITDHNKWYGALYNKIIMKKAGGKVYYTLLAWDGNDKFSQKKIIDVLTFDYNGNPHFGADIFNFGKRYPKRVIFEYSATCNTMPLKYSAKKDTIIFGHLAPMQPQLEGQYQYYCCDLSYDGFGWKKGKWNYGADVKALNEKDEKDNFYKDPHDRKEGHEQSNQYKDPNHKKRKKKQPR